MISCIRLLLVGCRVLIESGLLVELTLSNNKSYTTHGCDGISFPWIYPNIIIVLLTMHAIHYYFRSSAESRDGFTACMYYCYLLRGVSILLCSTSVKGSRRCTSIPSNFLYPLIPARPKAAAGPYPLKSNCWVTCC